MRARHLRNAEERDAGGRRIFEGISAGISKPTTADRKSCRCPDDDEYSVALHKDYWELCRFTDSDIGDVAVGRFESFEEGDTVRELILALRKLRPEPAPPPRKAPAVAASGNAPAARETGS